MQIDTTSGLGHFKPGFLREFNQSEALSLNDSYYDEPRTSGLAIASLVLGVLSIIPCFILTILFAIPGVVCGHSALVRINRSGGSLTGQGMAIAGLVTGYLGMLLFFALVLPIAIPNFVKARNASHAYQCAHNLQDIDAAKNAWAVDRKKSTGDQPAMADLKPYFKNQTIPVCPDGGTYVPGPVGEAPVCSVAGHQIAWAPDHLGRPNTQEKIRIVTATPMIQSTTVQAQPAAPRAEGFFIPAPHRIDMVHDAKRNVLYISDGDAILRYQMASKAFLPQLNLGGDLRGVDLSPDQDTLAVADSDATGSLGIHLVNLNSLSDQRVKFAAEPAEGADGTYSVAFGADGAVWITSGGSNWAPLRRYLPATQQMLIVSKSIRESTMLAASADREYVAFAEANLSSGGYGRLRSRAPHWLAPLSPGAFLYEIGINRDGSQLAVPTANEVWLPNAVAQKLEERQILCATYHPLRDYLFLTRGGSSTIAAYETTNYTMVKELDFGEPFEWIGNHAFQRGRLRLSGDGKYVFCTVSGGIRYAETGL